MAKLKPAYRVLSIMGEALREEMHFHTVGAAQRYVARANKFGLSPKQSLYLIIGPGDYNVAETDDLQKAADEGDEDAKRIIADLVAAKFEPEPEKEPSYSDLQPLIGISPNSAGGAGGAYYGNTKSAWTTNPSTQAVGIGYAPNTGTVTEVGKLTFLNRLFGVSNKT